jgi:hypothetical protein
MRFTITAMALFASIVVAAPSNLVPGKIQNGNGNNVPSGSVVPQCLASGDSKLTISCELGLCTNIK